MSFWVARVNAYRTWHNNGHDRGIFGNYKSKMVNKISNPTETVLFAENNTPTVLGLTWWSAIQEGDGWYRNNYQSSINHIYQGK